MKSLWRTSLSWPLCQWSRRLMIAAIVRQRNHTAMLLARISKTTLMSLERKVKIPSTWWPILGFSLAENFFHCDTIIFSVCWDASRSARTSTTPVTVNNWIVTFSLTRRFVPCYWTSFTEKNNTLAFIIVVLKCIKHHHLLLLSIARFILYHVCLVFWSNNVFCMYFTYYVLLFGIIRNNNNTLLLWATR